jgi:hypothetical protein
MKKLLSLAFAGALLLGLMPAGVRASQGTCILPNTGTVSGLTLVNDINACSGALLSLYSGASAPTSPTTGMLWYNTTSNYVQQYDGASWLNLWYVDATNHLTSMGIGGGIISQIIASAATTDLGSVAQPYKTISGVATITSLGSSAMVGSIHIAVFSGITTLTYNATSLIIPGAANKTTANGDMMIAVYLGSGNWRVLSYVAIASTSIGANTVLGSIAGGNPVALTQTQLTALINPATASLPGTLPAWPNNAALFLNGTGNYTAPPAAGTHILLATLTASNSASLNDSVACGGSNCLTSTYSTYELVFSNILPASNAATCEIEVHSGGAYPTATYLSNVTYWTGGAIASGAFPATLPCSAGGRVANTGTGVSGSIRIHNPSQTTSPKSITGTVSYLNSGGTTNEGASVSGFWNGGNGAVDGLKFLFDNGNITSGTIKIYGIQ